MTTPSTNPDDEIDQLLLEVLPVDVMMMNTPEGESKDSHTHRRDR